MNQRFGRRTKVWVDDIRGGLSAFVLEALIVVILVALALAAAFVAVTVV